MAEQDGTDEYTPYDRGLLIGSDLARGIARGELEITLEGARLTPDEFLRELAADMPRIPSSLRDLILNSGMGERLAASEDSDAESAFWGGFQTGVRAYIVETETGAGEN